MHEKTRLDVILCKIERMEDIRFRIIGTYPVFGTYPYYAVGCDKHRIDTVLYKGKRITAVVLIDLKTISVKTVETDIRPEPHESGTILYGTEDSIV